MPPPPRAVNGAVCTRNTSRVHHSDQRTQKRRSNLSTIAAAYRGLSRVYDWQQ
ncbi:Ff.00g065120.m01.CDS01 [Fusarium sp. VM40]|nr:Ff.00g065120.m01.CDS01 [Fusarium sp. VM40]